MINRCDILDAITKCVGYDPVHAPKQARIIEDAWAEHFERHPNITRSEILYAVTEYYDRSPDRRWPQPRDLSAIIDEQKHDPYEVGPGQPERYVPLPPGVSGDGVTPIASEEHRRKCMAEITATLNKRWSLP